MKNEKVTGIILSQKALFEKDKRIEIFTKSEGKKTALAKYANTKSFRFSGKLEPTNHVELILYKGRSFDIITQCTCLEHFSQIRNDFNKIALACYFIDIIRKTTAFNQANPNLFYLLLEGLSTLHTTNTPIQSIKTQFQNHFLKLEGLHKTNTSHTDSQFEEIIHHYSGHPLKAPSFI